MDEQVKFKGRVLYERYYNEDSFWGVFNVLTDQHLPYSVEYDSCPFDIFDDDKSQDKQYVVSVCGKVQHLFVGSEYEFIAYPQFSSKYNSWSYTPVSVTALAPKTQAEAQFFLEAILTTNQAKTILEHYPNIVQEVIDGHDNVDVSKLSGIGSVTWTRLRQKIVDNYVISDILTMLQPAGITYDAIKSLLKWEPNSAILKQKILDNPYVIIEAKGFGFDRVDKFALKLDPSLIDSSLRLFAFMRHYLSQAANNEGHTWVSIEAMHNGIIDQIPQCSGAFDHLFSPESKTNLSPIFYYTKDKIGLLKYRNYETSILEILKGLNEYKFNGNIDVESGIKKAEEKLGYELTEEQRNVVRQIQDNNVVIFTGGAGVGKTSCARAILESLDGSNIACCSLSAKAAQRIKEATGFKAMTIHRLLGFDGMSFQYNSSNRLPSDVVFIDECSMLNCEIFYDIVSAIKEGAKLIICGDYLQLPPIGAGNVFSDLLDMNDIFNISKLTKVHRQAEKSGILSDANNIRNGVTPIDLKSAQTTTGDLQDMMYVLRDQRERIQNIAVSQFVKISNSAGLNNVVLAVPRKDTVVNSALELNKRIQRELIDTKNTPFVESFYNKFYIGDRVLQIENDGERDIYNGEIGIIENVFSTNNASDVCMVVCFESTSGIKRVEYKKEHLRTVTLGYALTVHKLQGSEYPYTIVVIDNTHYSLLDTCLLYTAVTRAKKKCLMIAEPNAFRHAMAVNKNVNRQTWLKERS